MTINPAYIMKIAIASGKGGTGKTFVSTNLFAVAQKENKKVILTDCDAEEPNVTEFIKVRLLKRKLLRNSWLLLIRKNVCIAKNAVNGATTTQ